MNLRQKAKERLKELLLKPVERRRLISTVAFELNMRPGTIRGILQEFIDLRMIRRVGADYIMLIQDESVDEGTT